MAKKVVSIINLASVAEVESAAGAPVNPLRFRGNLYVAGWPAWHEFDLLDRELAIGAVRLKAVKRIVRCAATEVDPDTGIRDVAVPRTLMDNFGHADCGIYAEVIAGGDIAVATRCRLGVSLTMKWFTHAAVLTLKLTQCAIGLCMKKSRPANGEARFRNADPVTRSVGRHHIGGDARSRINRFGDRVVVIARHDDRIAVGIDAADHADMTAAVAAHHGDGADLRRRRCACRNAHSPGRDCRRLYGRCA